MISLDGGESLLGDIIGCQNLFLSEKLSLCGLDLGLSILLEIASSIKIWLNTLLIPEF
jgi:hypothetical protein